MYEEFFQSIFDGWYENVTKEPLLPVRVYEKKAPKIAVWSETKWALGRIADAIQKYVPNVDVHSWDITDFWVKGLWKDYDLIISNTSLHSVDKMFGVSPDPKKLFIIYHCPKFNLSWFTENTDFIEGATYAGVSRETCQELARHDIKASWTPFGADGDVFSLTHRVTAPIKRIGMINSDCNLEEYVKVKGLEKFKEICRLGDFEPVFIMGKSEKLYENIDLFICCSELEAGPLGIFEASSCGVPVMTTAVGNVQEIKGIALFDTAQEAVDRINSWNLDIDELRNYTERVTQEVRTHWSMDSLVNKYLKPVI
jgi:glycosyltransferase involved in cell wall biosynthesis